MPLYSHNGVLILASGGLAGGSACCCDGGAPNCELAYGYFGWYTDEGLQDYVALMQVVGYQNITWSPQFADGCGQTYYHIVAECCGYGPPCSTPTCANIRGIAGPGGQQPPCGSPNTEEVCLYGCCSNAPAP